MCANLDLLGTRKTNKEREREEREMKGVECCVRSGGVVSFRVGPRHRVYVQSASTCLQNAGVLHTSGDVLEVQSSASTADEHRDEDHT